MVFRGSGFRIKARRGREKPPWRACGRLADRGAGSLAELTGARSIAIWLSDDRRIPSHGRNDQRALPTGKLLSCALPGDHFRVRMAISEIRPGASGQAQPRRALRS